MGPKLHASRAVVASGNGHAGTCQRPVQSCRLVLPGPGARGSPDARDDAGPRREAAVRRVHGFRSSFRDWASEQTSVPHAVAEAALAHQVGSAVERSYARSDLLDKRRGMMDGWAEFVTS